MNNNILVTITGPSLTGKSKLAQVLNNFGFEEVVSTTTRPPRTGEIDGVHYHFVDINTFNIMEEQQLMIEKVKVGNNFYGVSKPAFEHIISKGKNGVAVVEPDGARQVAEYCLANKIKLHQVFVDNPTHVLVDRFLKRYKNDSLAQDEVYATRLIDMLQKEPKNWIEPAHNGTHPYDQIFSSFTPENEISVAEQIISAISNQLVKKNTTSRKKP
ncbi:guanylate kinase [archaeon]|nr:guanylate kinase [archaeon]